MCSCCRHEGRSVTGCEAGKTSSDVTWHSIVQDVSKLLAFLKRLLCAKYTINCINLTCDINVHVCLRRQEEGTNVLRAVNVKTRRNSSQGKLLFKDYTYAIDRFHLSNNNVLCM